VLTVATHFLLPFLHHHSSQFHRHCVDNISRRDWLGWLSWQRLQGNEMSHTAAISYGGTPSHFHSSRACHNGSADCCSSRLRRKHRSDTPCSTALGVSMKVHQHQVCREYSRSRQPASRPEPPDVHQKRESIQEEPSRDSCAPHIREICDCLRKWQC
jgi:hypothetical protein